MNRGAKIQLGDMGKCGEAIHGKLAVEKVIKRMLMV